MANIELKIVAVGDFKPVISQLTALETQANAVNKSMARMGESLTAKQAAQYSSILTDSIKASGLFRVETVKATSAAEGLGKRIATNKITMSDFTTAMKGLGKEASAYNQLARRQIAMQDASIIKTRQGNIVIAQQGVAMNNTAIKTRVLTEELRAQNAVLHQGAVNIINWGKNTQWAGRQLTYGITMPIAMLGAGMAKVFMDINSNMTRLSKVYGVSGKVSRDAIAAIQSDVMDLAKSLSSELGIAAKDVTDIAAEFAAAGYEGTKLIEATRQASKAVILGESDKASAVKATISLQSAYQLSMTETADAMNFFNAAQAATSTTMNDLINAIPRVGPIVKQLGGTYKDTVAILTAMKEGGIPVGEAANAIKTSLARIINPTKAAQERLAGFGIDIKSVVAKNAGDLTGTLKELQAELGKLSGLPKQQALSELFGKQQFGRMTAFIENFGQGQSAQIVKMMGLSSQELTRIADEQTKKIQQSASGRFKIVVESLKNSLLPVGEATLNLFTDLLEKMQGFFDFLLNLPGPVKAILKAFGGLALLSGPVLMFAGLFANLSGFMIKMGITVRTFFMALKSGANPIEILRNKFKEYTAEMRVAAEGYLNLGKVQDSEKARMDALTTSIMKQAAAFDQLSSSIASTADINRLLSESMAMAGMDISTGFESSRNILRGVTRFHTVPKSEIFKQAPLAGLSAGGKTDVFPEYGKGKFHTGREGQASEIQMSGAILGTSPYSKEVNSSVIGTKQLIRYSGLTDSEQQAQEREMLDIEKAINDKLRKFKLTQDQREQLMRETFVTEEEQLAIEAKSAAQRQVTQKLIAQGNTELSLLVAQYVSALESAGNDEEKVASLNRAYQAHLEDYLSKNTEYDTLALQNLQEYNNILSQENTVAGKRKAMTELMATLTADEIDTYRLFTEKLGLGLGAATNMVYALRASAQNAVLVQSGLSQTAELIRSRLLKTINTMQIPNPRGGAEAVKQIPAIASSTAYFQKQIQSTIDFIDKDGKKNIALLDAKGRVIAAYNIETDTLTRFNAKNKQDLLAAELAIKKSTSAFDLQALKVQRVNDMLLSTDFAALDSTVKNSIVTMGRFVDEDGNLNYALINAKGELVAAYNVQTQRVLEAAFMTPESMAKALAGSVSVREPLIKDAAEAALKKKFNATLAGEAQAKTIRSSEIARITQLVAPGTVSKAQEEELRAYLQKASFGDLRRIQSGEDIFNLKNISESAAAERAAGRAKLLDRLRNLNDPMTKSMSEQQRLETISRVSDPNNYQDFEAPEMKRLRFSNIRSSYRAGGGGLSGFRNVLSQNRGLSMGAGMGIMMGGQLISGMMPEGTTGKETLSMASTGAGMGMMLGPTGALVGAAAGALIGIFNELGAAAEKTAAGLRSTLGASKEEFAALGIAIEPITTNLPGFNDKLDTAASAVENFRKTIQEAADTSEQKQFVEKLKGAGTNQQEIDKLLSNKARALALGGASKDQVGAAITAYMQEAGITRTGFDVSSLFDKSGKAKSNLAAAALTAALDQSNLAGMSRVITSPKPPNTLGGAFTSQSINASFGGAASPAAMAQQSQITAIAESLATPMQNLVSTKTSIKDFIDSMKELQNLNFSKVTVGGQALEKTISEMIKDKPQLKELNDRLTKMGVEPADKMIYLKAAIEDVGGSLANLPTLTTVQVEVLLNKKQVELDAAAAQQKAIDAIAKKQSDVATATATTTDNQSKKYQKMIDALKEEQALKQKMLDMQKKELEYSKQKLGLENQLRDALASGNLLKAAEIRQQMAVAETTKNAEDNAQKGADATQAKIDALQKKIDALQAKSASAGLGGKKKAEPKDVFANKQAMAMAGIDITKMGSFEQFVNQKSVKAFKDYLLNTLKMDKKSVNDVLSGMYNDYDPSVDAIKATDAYAQSLKTRMAKLNKQFADGVIDADTFRENARAAGAAAVAEIADAISKGQFTFNIPSPSDTTGTGGKPSGKPTPAQTVKKFASLVEAQANIGKSIKVGKETWTVVSQYGSAPYWQKNGTSETLPAYAMGGLIGYANSGFISGPGTGTSDSILARVSNGEWIMRAAAVQRYGPSLMSSLNNLSFPVPGGALGYSGQGGGTSINNTFYISGADPSKVADEVMKKINVTMKKTGAVVRV